MARANRRGGFGELRGATNNRSVISSEAPNDPLHLDRWVDKDTNQEYYWNKPTTEWIPLFGAGGGGNLGGLVYHNDTNTTAVSTNVEVGTIDVTMAFDGSLVVTGTFVGTASVAMTITSLIKLDTVTQHTAVQYISGAVDDTVSFSVVLEDVVAGDYTVSVDMAASTGTFTLDASEQHLYALTYYGAVIGGETLEPSTEDNLYLQNAITLGSPFTVVLTVEKFDGTSWSSSVDTPSPARRNSSSCNLNGSGFLIAGQDAGGTYLLDNDGFDTTSWTAYTNIVTPQRITQIQSELGGYIYCYYGVTTGSPISDNDRFDGVSTWVSKTSGVAPARYDHSGESDGSYIYAMTGRTSPSSADLLDNDRYSEDSWTSMTSVPSPARNVSRSFFVGGYIYICGGRQSTTTLIADVDRYVSDTWSSVTSISSATRDAAAGDLNDVGYFMCGVDGSGLVKTVESYVFDTWTTEASTTNNSVGGTEFTI